MPKPKICFDQVPLRVVKKILEDQAQPKKRPARYAGPRARSQQRLFGGTRDQWRRKDIAPQKRRARALRKSRKAQTMNDEELKFPAWQVPLQDLILEFDREKLAEKIQKVENLIFERQQQLNQASDGHAEREAIYDALNIIRVIKRDKLGFPDWRKSD
jgi:hypothetical protein